MTSDIAVAAPILARTDAEADMLIRSMESLAAHGFPVLLADGGSVNGFTGRLAQVPGVVVETAPEKGLVAQVRHALEMAQRIGSTHLLYTEPDKHWFFDSRLADFLGAVQNGVAMTGVAFPARD